MLAVDSREDSPPIRSRMFISARDKRVTNASSFQSSVIYGQRSIQPSGESVYGGENVEPDLKVYVYV